VTPQDGGNPARAQAHRLQDIRPAPLPVRVLPSRVPDIRLVPQADRRDPSSRQSLNERVCAEFREMPGLSLTLAQARRLLGMREDICTRVLDGLVVEGQLIRTPNGVYRKSMLAS